MRGAVPLAVYAAGMAAPLFLMASSGTASTSEAATGSGAVPGGPMRLTP
jgi:cytochrome c biogenesis protein CcdA